MIVYEIINPSDAATFLAPDRTIALAVLALLGEGWYGVTPLERDGQRILEEEAKLIFVPPFIGKGAYESWWRSAGYTEEPIEVALKTRAAELVAALRSCSYGDLEDRKTYDSACNAITDPEKLKTFKSEWEDRRRSSMNRIVQRAWAWADRIEEREAA
ncbi:MAG: hypothetical protein ACOYLQ_09700 [Hyphomicrobiaceae bacterium]